MADPTSTEKPTPSSGPRGVVGLRNLGNTCYANAAIQALRQITEMTYLCLTENSELKRKNDSHSGVLFQAYTDLIRTMWTTHKPAFISPNAFWKDMLVAATASGYEHFQGRQPQDAHEFMMFLLDQMLEGTKEEVNYIIQRPPPVSDEDRRIQSALESWKQNFQKQYTPIVDIWFGLLEYQTECQTCKKKTYRYETFNSLKVTMPTTLVDGKLPTIREMLRADWADETIEGFHCETCEPVRTTVKRKVTIWRMPRCLIVVLKRFTPDGRKIHTNWAHEEMLSLSEFFSEASPERSKSYSYDLQSVVDHHGSSRGGHYTAQGLSPLDSKWYVYDDESTAEIEKPMLGQSSYILLFRVKQN